MVFFGFFRKNKSVRFGFRFQKLKTDRTEPNRICTYIYSHISIFALPCINILNYTLITLLSHLILITLSHSRVHTPHFTITFHSLSQLNSSLYSLSLSCFPLIGQFHCTSLVPSHRRRRLSTVTPQLASHGIDPRRGPSSHAVQIHAVLHPLIQIHAIV